MTGQTTIAWSTRKSVWEIWQDDTCIAHTRSLNTAQRKFPNSVLMPPRTEGE